MARRPGRAKASSGRGEEAKRSGGSRASQARGEQAEARRAGSDAIDHALPDAGGARADRAEEARIGRLTVVATPIGNLGDLSPRALAALEGADVLACEDTSVGARLLAANGLRRSILRLDEHAPESKLRAVIEHALGGKSVVYFSDAGTPGVSDPGPALVDLAFEAGVEVDAIPGPSALLTAVMLSGFFAQKLVFLGFLQRRPGAIRSELAPFAESTTTLVFFEAGNRLGKTLQTALEALGERRVAVCREMTKSHQEVIRGDLSELANSTRTFKGECTVVLEGKRKSLARGS